MSALNVKCPTCGAEADLPCSTGGQSHASRISLSLQLGDEADEEFVVVDDALDFERNKVVADAITELLQAAIKVGAERYELVVKSLPLVRRELEASFRKREDS